MPNIENILQSKPAPVTFNVLGTIINATGLEYTFKGDTQVTLFAPPDSVFNKLGQGVVYNLLKDITKLRELLQYHTVPLRLTTAAMEEFASSQPLEKQEPPSVVPRTRDAHEIKLLELPTASGHPLTVDLSNGITVQGVRVIEPEILADNGVIYVIDNVLWPPGLSIQSFGDRSPESGYNGSEVVGG